MQKLVSIIVPVYNVEKYIDKCVRSLLKQDYGNIEVILVDDGSPDKSGYIIDRLKEEDNRIVVIHQENHGVSSARNAGMAVASGEYITFVDGDDWVDANYVTYFVDLLEKSSCDVVMNKNNYSGCNDISNNNFSVISAEKAIEWIYLGDLFVAVSYKLPTLVSTLTGIFNQAWSYSAIREEGTSDETEYNNKMFKTLSAIAFMMGIGLLLLTKPFLGVYVADSYYDAWKYTPFLIIGCVYLTLGTFMATSYTVHKDSFGYLFSGSFGAAFNILLNFILIPVIGVYGAALATCISYIAVFMFRVFHTRKYIKYDIMYKEFILGSLLMLVSAILMFVDGMKGFLLQLVILLIGFTVFSKTWIPMLQFFLNKIQRKRVS